MIYCDNARLEKTLYLRVAPPGQSATVMTTLRHFRGRWSNLTADSLKELHEFSRSLTRGVRVFKPQSDKGRFRYEVTERALREAVTRGSVILPFGTPEWLNIFNVRKLIYGEFNAHTIAYLPKPKCNPRPYGETRLLSGV